MERAALVFGMVWLAGACERDDNLRCGDGTVERDGACVVAGTGDDGDSDDDGSDSQDDGSLTQGDTPMGDSSGGEVPGACVGEPRSCSEIEGEDACLAQNGCYPTSACLGEEADCTIFGYATEECDESPHCYSDIMMSGTTSLPGCWPYDTSCEMEFTDCEAYGGTCHEGTVCDGSAEWCELRIDQSSCEDQDGCYWQT